MMKQFYVVYVPAHLPYSGHDVLRRPRWVLMHYRTDDIGYFRTEVMRDITEAMKAKEEGRL